MNTKLEYETFNVIVESLKNYSAMLNGVESALGGIVLEDCWQAVNPIYTELERLSGVVWTDELWDALFDDQKSVEEAWKILQQLQEEKVNG